MIKPDSKYIEQTVHERLNALEERMAALEKRQRINEESQQLWRASVRRCLTEDGK